MQNPHLLCAAQARHARSLTASTGARPLTTPWVGSRIGLSALEQQRLQGAAEIVIDGNSKIDALSVTILPPYTALQGVHVAFNYALLTCSCKDACCVASWPFAMNRHVPVVRL